MDPRRRHPGTRALRPEKSPGDRLITGGQRPGRGLVSGRFVAAQYAAPTDGARFRPAPLGFRSRWRATITARLGDRSRAAVSPQPRPATGACASRAGPVSLSRASSFPASSISWRSFDANTWVAGLKNDTDCMPKPERPTGHSIKMKRVRRRNPSRMRVYLVQPYSILVADVKQRRGVKSRMLTWTRSPP